MASASSWGSLTGKIMLGDNHLKGKQSPSHHTYLLEFSLSTYFEAKWRWVYLLSASPRWKYLMNWKKDKKQLSSENYSEWAAAITVLPKKAFLHMSLM